MEYWDGVGNSLLNMFVKEGLSEKVTFKQRPEDFKRARNVGGRCSRERRKWI